MAYFEVEVFVDKEGDLYVTVCIPLRFVAPSSKFIYEPLRRKVMLRTTISYFNKKMLSEIIKNAEVEYKKKYGERIKISKLKFIEYGTEREELWLKYKAILGKHEHRNKTQENIL